MNRKLVLASAVAWLGMTVWSPVASAFMVAGWDFSQFFGPGLLSVDGETFTTILDSNYSTLDPTFGLGPDSGVFGTLHYDGQFGSTAITPDGTGNEPVIPVEGSLLANINAPVDAGGIAPFDSGDLLISQGQVFWSPLGVVAKINSRVSLVFVADLTTVPETGSDWVVTFGGATLESTSPVEIEFSTDGANYGPIRTVTLTEVDSLFTVPLGPDPSEVAYVRFTFDPETGEEFPIIDNVAILVPEPGAASAGGAALAALVLGSRARSRRRA